MPSISNVDLTMSRDSNGVVTARIDFELQFSQFEIDVNVPITERVALVRQIGNLDRWELGTGGAVQSQSGGGSQLDTTIAVLSSSDVDAASLGLAAGAGGSVTRSFTHVLTAAERAALLEVGPDHPYAVVSVVPNGLSADLKLAAVEMLDVGDPETVTTVDGPGHSGSSDTPGVVTLASLDVSLVGGWQAHGVVRLTGPAGPEGFLVEVSVQYEQSVMLSSTFRNDILGPPWLVPILAGATFTSFVTNYQLTGIPGGDVFTAGPWAGAITQSVNLNP
jgi:hypothetical protein